MKKIIKYICFALVVFLGSCDKSDLYDGMEFMDTEGTKSVKFAGTWYVKFDNFHPDKWVRVNTYNTAENEKNVFWVKSYGTRVVSDDPRVNSFVLKCTGDDSDMSFESQSDQDVYGSTNNGTVSGSIVKDGFTTESGNTTDKITLTITFTEEPGVTYTAVGYKRTGWSEDDVSY